MKLYNISCCGDALSAMHFRHTEIGYIIMAIYLKLHLMVPVIFERYMSVNLLSIDTNLKDSRMHSYRILGEFNTPFTPIKISIVIYTYL